jgi:thioesterase domain-containing protein
VEAAALYNLRALAEFDTAGPIHLLGHSHGGLVAFEMALRLLEKGRRVASLTLIDTAPPGREENDKAVSTPEIFKEFVEVFESMFDRSFNISEAVLLSGDSESFVRALHAALVRARYLHPSSAPAVLRGSLAVYKAARCSSSYKPATCYPHKMHLVQVGERPTQGDDLDPRQGNVAQWREYASELDIWYGPGHHFSILRAPHVESLARWWLQERIM